jgi:hypothetical protein
MRSGSALMISVMLKYVPAVLGSPAAHAAHAQDAAGVKQAVPAAKRTEMSLLIFMMLPNYILIGTRASRLLATK